MTIPDTLMICLVGIAVVFAVLIILMFFIKLMSLVLHRHKAHRMIPAVATRNFRSEEIEATTADGSCGTLRLRNVSRSTAAMIMAIVADELQVPLNELRFISISEVGDVQKEAEDKHEV